MLWRSVPDERLLEAARGGELDTADGVAAVAGRMLGDPRADRFAASFGRQWLQLDGLRGKRADRKRFPDFDGRLARSMVEETERVLLDSLRERRSMWDLVDGTTTFVDERLARHYGLDALDGEPVDGGWRRVDLSGTERRGLLGHASVLFLTSEPERTSPVKRGKWVLDVLLGAAPPPPPPGVDSLPEDGAKKGEDGEELSLRGTSSSSRTPAAACTPAWIRLRPPAFDLMGALREGERHGRAAGRARFRWPLGLAEVLREAVLKATVERLHLRSCEGLVPPIAPRSRRSWRPSTRSPDARGRPPRSSRPTPSSGSRAMTDTSRDIPISELAGSGPRLTSRPFRDGRCSAALVSLALPGSRRWRARRRVPKAKRLVYVYVQRREARSVADGASDRAAGPVDGSLAGEHALKELPPLMRPLAAHLID